MPIVLDMSAGTAGEVRFMCSPLVELGWAWHVLVGADHHPQRSRWAALLREELPGDLVRDLEAWSFAVRAVRATMLADPTFVPAARWEDQLAWVIRMPAAEFAAALLRPLLRLRGRPGSLGDPRVRDRVLSVARAHGPATAGVVGQLLADPGPAQHELAELLARCWARFFQAEWQRTAPVLGREIDLRSRRLARDGWLPALQGLSPAVTARVDGRLVIDKVQSKRLAVAGRGLVLVPTLLADAHVYVADEPGRPVVVHYPFPAPSRAADQRLTLRRLTVLAHPARLEVCRAIAVEPRSALEIARLWRFAESAVTKHLSALRGAGLVRAERTGHFVRYSLDTGAIEELGGDLVEVLRR